MVTKRAGILGTGHSYPEGILTNADLATMVDTSDEWITTRTGIKQRRMAAPEEYTSQFAVLAGRQAIERAGIEVDDIDALYARAKSLGHEIIYDLKDEPWGVRRFYVRDPAGKLLNILAHTDLIP